MNRTAICNAFALQNPPRGRASALSYDGRVAYSYGMHFPLAVVLTTKDGPKQATVNRDKYSSTTSRHQSAIRYALTRAGYSITEADTAEMKNLAAQWINEP